MLVIIENYSSILDMRLSKEIPDRMDLSSSSITGVLDNHIALVVVSLIVPKVDIVLVSNSGTKIFDTIASFGRVSSFVMRVMSTQSRSLPVLRMSSSSLSNFVRGIHVSCLHLRLGACVAKNQ